MSKGTMLAAKIMPAKIEWSMIWKF